MAVPDVIISTNTRGDPEIGPEIEAHGRGLVTLKPRVVVGWSHQNDTPNGLQSGKIWGWTSDGNNHFQVYDENFNRSPHAGDVRFCGVANFTMVRMFHPYWAHFGRVPRDKHSADKRRCRHKYNQLIRKWRINKGLPVDEEPDNPIQPPNGELRRVRRTRLSRAGRAPGRKQRVVSERLSGRDKSMPGIVRDEPGAISNDEDNAQTGTNIGRNPIDWSHLSGGAPPKNIQNPQAAPKLRNISETDSPDVKDGPIDVDILDRHTPQAKTGGCGSARDSFLRPRTVPVNTEERIFVLHEPASDSDARENKDKNFDRRLQELLLQYNTQADARNAEQKTQEGEIANSVALQLNSATLTANANSNPKEEYTWTNMPETCVIVVDD